MEVTIKKQESKAVYISHPESSWSIFMYNKEGDLLINGDWGMFGYAWRAFGDETFEHFLSTLNMNYLVGKLSIEYINQTGKKMPSHITGHLTVLCQEFVNELKN